MRGNWKELGLNKQTVEKKAEKGEEG